MEKLYIYGGITIGGLLGAYIPVWLFGVDGFSLLSLVGGFIGSLLGLFFGYKALQNFGE
jgi:hypothetical protein